MHTVEQATCFASRALILICLHGRGRGANPIAHVLQAIGEPLELLQYDSWNVLLPEGEFLTRVGPSQFEEVLQAVSPAGIPEWRVRAHAFAPCRLRCTSLTDRLPCQGGPQSCMQEFCTSPWACDPPACMAQSGLPGCLVCL